MKYYRWLGEITGVEFPTLDYKERWWMVECSPVDDWDGQMTGTYAPKRVGLKSREPQFNFGIALNSWPIFSSELKDFLERQAPDHIQFLPFPLRVGRWRPRILTGYYVGQFLRLVECLDRKRTAVRDNCWEPVNKSGDFDIRSPVVLDTAAIGDEKLFRVFGYRLYTVIREDLKDAIERHGFAPQRFDLMETS